MEDGSDAQFIVKMSGMPFSASCEDVAKFLAGLDIKGGRKNGVHITKDDSGRVSGECYVELTCKEDVEAAIRKDHQYMGERWVSVTEASNEAMVNDISKCDQIQQKLDDKGEFVIKVRGLPWSSNTEDIESFFGGCNLKDDKESSIHILRNSEGRLTGQAFIEFGDIESLNQGLGKNREHMGKRYLEVSRSSKDEMSRFTEKSNTVSKMREPVVLCRGLPFSATEEDVCSFFSGLEIADLQMVYDTDGVRPMGKCFVQFGSVKDSEAAMAKFGEKMSNRYIEIFQSNRKYWYAQEGVPMERGGPHAEEARHAPPPRGRPRPGPYSKPPRGGAGGYAPPPRGGRIKHMSHDRRSSPYGGYDGSEGFAVQDYSAGAGGTRAAGLPKKHIVVVKGVSMDVSMGDVIKFFTESNPPKNVEMKFGEAVVEFHSHGDAMRAMLKDKTMLAGVKVNLELQSKPEDYVGYSDSAPAEDPYQDPYSTTFSDPYQQSKPYQGTYSSSYRW
ncbi:heterogeneous nuclear ribonucleoprotein F-like isoform X1 [Bolinopsis microptera]|uniref:heterogeneous nuclear ribonucleoprotein F-like isoform X1 n=2 Tax=Bolinopsis microptera TaxID=2820187 RepID=UPI003079B9BF